jgi:hypothetical protein
VAIAERVQQYRIESRRQTHMALAVGPFTVLLHPTDGAIENNIAIPHTPPSEAPEQSWREAVRAAFASHGCTPVIQWIADFAPYLASTLQAMGFSEHQRETLLVCTPESRLRAPAPVAGLTFVTITDASPQDGVRESLDVNEFGFDPNTAQPATDEHAMRVRTTLRVAWAYTARLDGYQAGAGMYTTPMAGVTELAGIPTLEQYQGGEIAAVLTAHMASSAFTQGCDLAFLTTANPAARRAFAHAGFRPTRDVLIYVAPGAGLL